MNQDTTTPAQQEATFQVTGASFYNVCAYVGSMPLKQVVSLRKGLWELQKEQKCLSPNALPAYVTLSKSNVDTLINFLSECPCDQVFDILQAFEQDLMNYVEAADNVLKQQAAVQVLEDAMGVDLQGMPPFSGKFHGMPVNSDLADIAASGLSAELKDQPDLTL